jgi:uncharacterized membrane protein YjdF
MRRVSTLKHLITFLFFTCELAGLIALLVTGNYIYIGMLIGNSLFWLVYLVLEAKMEWELPLYIRIMVVVSILGNGILGGVFKLYLTTSFFDNVLHFVASYSVAIWAYYIVQQYTGVIVTKKKFHFIIILCLGLALGAFYEILEFAIDHLVKLKKQNQASLYDTDLDLLSDFFGGLVAAFHFICSTRLNSFLISLKRHPIKPRS